MLRAADIMTESPVTVTAQATVGDAARTLDSLSVRHLPVVNEDAELIGMISDRDLRGDAGGGGATEDLVTSAPPLSAQIVEIMSSDVVQASPDDDLKVLAELMLDNKVGAVPVVDNDGLLVGIVSYVDILRALVEGEEVGPNKTKRAKAKAKPAAKAKAKAKAKPAAKAKAKPAAKAKGVKGKPGKAVTRKNHAGKPLGFRRA
jgi:acetoin utilization protein AcuB